MATMLARGATQRQIAEAFDLALSTVNRDVVEIRRRWRKDSSAKIDDMKGRLFAGQDEVVREAWTEWERSKADAQEIDEYTELVEDPYAAKENDAAIAKGEPVRPKMMAVTKRVVTTKGQTGDPRYLTAIINARAEQAKILGAHAPASVHHSGEAGGPIQIQTIELIPPAEPQPEPEPES